MGTVSLLWWRLWMSIGVHPQCKDPEAKVREMTPEEVIVAFIYFAVLQRIIISMIYNFSKKENNYVSSILVIPINGEQSL